MKLTLSMIVHNEADRYLRRVLEAAREYVTDAVIIDDASTDDTVSVIGQALDGLPVRIVHNTESKFSREVDLRKQQWSETMRAEPDWILTIDADQIFEKSFKDHVPSMLASDVDAHYFRLYDFWNEEEYRDDQFWGAHKVFRPFMVRASSLSIATTWRETPQHCGSLPLEVSGIRYACSPLRLKHFGWARFEDRVVKYERYKRLDPDGVYGWPAQYESILDPHPNLVRWVE